MRAPVTCLMTALSFAAFVGSAASAQHAAPCDWHADARGIVEPWEDHIRSFANGAVRVALIDTVEPAAGALHLLVLTPPYTAGMGERHCWVVGWDQGIGFVSLDFAGMVPGYDPARGLSLVLPARFYDPALEFSNIGLLEVVINQATGEVTAGFTVTGLD